jgi:DNA repair exonuclease SbcCD ATPase subunit
VIASRVGALDESVRDGVDGLLVEPGDPFALAEAMEQLAARPELLSRLVAGIAPVARIDDHVAWLTERYARLRAQRPLAAQDPLPPHLHDFVARVRAFQSLPIRELYARVASGLDELAASLDQPAPALPEVRGSPVQDELRDRRREVEWLRESASAKELELADSRRELGEAAAASRAFEAERDWLRGTLSERDTEIGWLRTAVMQLERDQAAERAEAAHGLASLHKEIEWRRELLATLESDRERLRGVIAGLEAERDALLELRATLASVESERAKLAEHFAALEAHSRWLESEAESARTTIDAMQRELTWRREQMDALTREGGAVIRALVRRSALGRRMSRWSEESGGGAA